MKKISQLSTSIGQLIAGDFFFGMKSCEYYTTPNGDNKQINILRKGEIRFYRKQRELMHSSGCIHLEEKESLKFRTQNNGVTNTTLTQWRTGKHLCQVKLWSDIIIRMEPYPGTTDDNPVDTVWVENHKKTTTSQMTIKLLRSFTL